jgi:hypothetical protein
MMRYHSYVVFLIFWTFVIFLLNRGGCLVYFLCVRIVPLCAFLMRLNYLLKKKSYVAVAVSLLHSNLLFLFYF